MNANERAKNKLKLREDYVIVNSDKQIRNLVNSYTKTDNEILRTIRKRIFLNHKRFYKRLAKTENITRKTFIHKQHYKNVLLLMNNDKFMYYTRTELINLYFVVMNINDVNSSLVSSSITRFA